MVCYKKGMVLTVSNAPGLTSDKGYKKSLVNLETAILAEDRSERWSAGIKARLEGEEAELSSVDYSFKKFSCTVKETTGH